MESQPPLTWVVELRTNGPRGPRGLVRYVLGHGGRVDAVELSPNGLAVAELCVGDRLPAADGGRPLTPGDGLEYLGALGEWVRGSAWCTAPFEMDEATAWLGHDPSRPMPEVVLRQASAVVYGGAESPIRVGVSGTCDVQVDLPGLAAAAGEGNGTIVQFSWRGGALWAERGDVETDGELGELPLSYLEDVLVLPGTVLILRGPQGVIELEIDYA